MRIFSGNEKIVGAVVALGLVAVHALGGSDALARQGDTTVDQASKGLPPPWAPSLEGTSSLGVMGEVIPTETPTPELTWTPTATEVTSTATHTPEDTPESSTSTPTLESTETPTPTQTSTPTPSPTNTYTPEPTPAATSTPTITPPPTPTEVPDGVEVLTCDYFVPFGERIFIQHGHPHESINLHACGVLIYVPNLNSGPDTPFVYGIGSLMIPSNFDVWTPLIEDDEAFVVVFPNGRINESFESDYTYILASATLNPGRSVLTTEGFTVGEVNSMIFSNNPHIDKVRVHTSTVYYHGDSTQQIDPLKIDIESNGETIYPRVVPKPPETPFRTYLPLAMTSSFATDNIMGAPSQSLRGSKQQ